MEAAGHIRKPRRWFEIPADRFTPENTALYLPGESQADETIIAYTPGCLADYTEVPEAQKRFYRAAEPGKQVFVFGGIPHILYRGEIDVTGLPVLEV
jgi:hypothetical protein